MDCQSSIDAQKELDAAIQEAEEYSNQFPAEE